MGKPTRLKPAKFQLVLMDGNEDMYSVILNEHQEKQLQAMILHQFVARTGPVKIHHTPFGKIHHLTPMREVSDVRS